MIYPNNFCTEFMFLVVMVCTFLSTISSVIVNNFPLVFKISLLFVEHVYNDEINP